MEPVMTTMNKDFAISLDIGGSFIKGALIDRNGRILSRYKTPTGSGQGKDAVIKNIVTVIDQVVNDEVKNRIAGIGVGVPGSVDTRTGTIIAGNSIKNEGRCGYESFVC